MITLAYLYAMALAWINATDDADDIAAHEPIPHGWAFWLRRAFSYAVPVTVFALVSGNTSHLIAALIGGGALFAIIHRYVLNWQRLLPSTYTSNSNGYDRAWRKVFGEYAGHAMYVLEAAITLLCA